MAHASKPHIEGLRVIRGPDWKAADLDGGEGHVGTVTSLPGSGMVHVIWDVGQEMDCRAGQEGKFDLRVFDSGTVDVHHGAPCQSCQQDVYGALWRCQNCPACSLCSRCYADDKHEAGHPFLRFDLPASTGKLMKKRKISVKIRAVGLFPGATVVRGHHWKWGDQDGGPGSEGEIVDYVECHVKKGRRNVVTVKWPNGSKNVYRVGVEGLVDIKCHEEEVGGFYYRDHLPVLDSDDFSSLTLDAPGAKTGPVPSVLTLSPREQLPSEDDHEPQVAHYNVNETTLAPATVRTDGVAAVEKEVANVRNVRLQKSASSEEGNAQSLRIEIPSVSHDFSSRLQTEETLPSAVEDGKPLEQSQEGGELCADRGETLDKGKEEMEEDRLATTLQTSDTSEAPPNSSDASDVSAQVSGLSDTSLQTSDISDVPISLLYPSPDTAGSAGSEGQGLTAGSSTEDEVASAGIGTVDTMEAAPETVAAAGSDAEIVNVADTGKGSHMEGAAAGGWRIGDRAVIAVPKEELKELQHGFGGVTHTMLKKIGRMGVVTRLGPGPNTVGFRLGRTVFRVNTAVLQQVHTFTEGDTVRILDDLYKLNIVNERMGWRDHMDDTAGKVGQITKIDEDGDLYVQFADRKYIYSPACCIPAPGATVDAVRDHAGGAGNNLGTLLGGDAGDLSERLAGLMRGAGGGGGGGGGAHGVRLRDLARMGGLGDPTGLGGLAGLASLNLQLLEHLQDLQSTVGMSGLGDLDDDESQEGELHKAILVGDLKKVKELCLAKPSLANSLHNEYTPLMVACRKGRRKIVEALLDMGANINARGPKDYTSLCVALNEKEEEVALLLIERGADVTTKSEKGATPLHMAVFHSCNEAAQLIIHMGADVNAQDKYGDTPLHDAIAQQNVGMVELLMQMEQVNMHLTNKRGYTPLMWACKVKNAETLTLILSRDSTNINQLKDREIAAIHIAAFEKFFEGMRLLVSMGNADVNLKTGDRGLSALHVACQLADAEAAEFLLSMGADANVQDRNGETPLHLAIGGTDGKSDKSMFDMEQDVQSRIRIARLLISGGAYVDAENKKGRPPTTYGPPEVQNAVKDFMEHNPGLVLRKKASKPAGGVTASIMTSLKDVSMPCRLCLRPSDVTLVPCGHRTVCRACAVSVKSCPLCGAIIRREETIKGIVSTPKVDAKKTDENGVHPKPITKESALASEMTATKLDTNSVADKHSTSAQETLDTDPPYESMEQKSGSVTESSSNMSLLLAGVSNQRSANAHQERHSGQHQAELEPTLSQPTNFQVQKDEPNVGRESIAASLGDAEQIEQKADKNNTLPKPFCGLSPVTELSSGLLTLHGDKDLATDDHVINQPHLPSEAVAVRISQVAVSKDVPRNCPSAFDQCATTLEPEAVLSAENPSSSHWTFRKTQEAADSETFSETQRRDVVFSFRGSQSRMAESGPQCVVRPKIFSPVDEDAVPWSLPRRQHPPAMINDNKAFDKNTANPALPVSEGRPSQAASKTTTTSLKLSFNKELELPELPKISLDSMWGQDSSSTSKDVPKLPDSVWKPQSSPVPISAVRKPKTADFDVRKVHGEVEASATIPNEPGLAGGALNMETSRMTSRRHLSLVSRSDVDRSMIMNKDIGHLKDQEETTEEPASLTEELVRRDLGLPPRLPSQGISQTTSTKTPNMTITSPEKLWSANAYGIMPSLTEKDSTAVLKLNKSAQFNACEPELSRGNPFLSNQDQLEVKGDFGESRNNTPCGSVQEKSDADAMAFASDQPYADNRVEQKSPRDFIPSDPRDEALSDASHSISSQTEAKTENQDPFIITTEGTEPKENYTLNIQTVSETQNPVATCQNEITDHAASCEPAIAETHNQVSATIAAGKSEAKEDAKKDKIDVPKTFIHVDNLAAIFSSVRLQRNVGHKIIAETAKRPTTSIEASSSMERQHDNDARANNATPHTLLPRDLTDGRHEVKREDIVANAKNGPIETSESANNDFKIQVGHRVVIKVKEEDLNKLQTNFGGATKTMIQCLGHAGVVTSVDKDGSVRVQFKSMSYRFNPQTLMRVPDLRVGDVVRIHDDLELVQRLNKLVGFGSGMVETLGKIGKITSIDSDGDVKVSFGQSSFLYSPACCVPSPGVTVDALAAREQDASAFHGSSNTNDSPAEIDTEGLEKVKLLAQMVKEEGSSMSKILNYGEDESSSTSRLFHAITDGDSALVRSLCQSDPSLLSRAHKQRRLTPLMYATFRGMEKMVDLLLDLGADVNQLLAESSKSYDSCCPLLAGLESGREDAAVILLQRGADPNCHSLHSQKTPLHYCAEKNLLQVLQVLLLNGADVNAQDRIGSTPLNTALNHGHKESAEIILGDPRVDITLRNYEGYSPLHSASLKNFPSVVQEILLKDTSQVNDKTNGEYAPLHMAANSDCLEIIKLLVILGGADVNCVAGRGKHEGTRPLHHSCLNGNYSCVEALLDFGADVNVEDVNGDTPLHFAIGGTVHTSRGKETKMMFIEARVRIACLLISNGAFVDAENHAGRTFMRYGVPEVEAAVQDFMDRNRHLVRKKVKLGVDRAEPGPCAVCKTRTSAVTLLPCGHKVTCSECSVGLSQCPQCQKAVLDSTTDDAKGALFEPI